jgi:hypothetical protein
MALSRQPFVAEMYSLNNNDPVQRHFFFFTMHGKPAQNELFQLLMLSRIR